MEEKKCILQGNRLDIELALRKTDKNYTVINSSKYVISGKVEFQVKMNVIKNFIKQNYNGYNEYEYVVLVHIRFVKILQSDDLTYATTICSSQDLLMKNISFSNIDTPWSQIYEYYSKTTASLNFSIDLTVVLDLQSDVSPLASLYHDTDLTDFELRGKDGSVHVHKAILAGYSPVLRSLVAGDWREAKEGTVKVEGTTKETLQHLKEYMYSDKLPEKGLEHLIVLACYYMMEDLEQKCSFKLLNNLSVQNGLELAEFAAKNGMRHLFLAIIKNIQRGIINVDDMEKLLLGEKLIENKDNKKIENQTKVESENSEEEDDY